MEGISHITARVRNFIVIIVALGFLFVIGHGFITAERILHRPFAGFLLLRNNFVPVLYLPEWDGFQGGIKEGDIVTAVNGRPVRSADEVRQIVWATAPGTALTYTVLRGGQRHEFSVPVSVFITRDMIILSFSWQLMGLIFIGSSLAVFYLRPNQPVSWAFLFHGIVAGYSTAAAPAYCIINSNNLVLILVPLLGPSILVLSLYFPAEMKAPKKYFFALLALASLLIIFFNLYYFMDIPRFLVWDKISIGYTAVAFAGGSALMFRSFVRSRDTMVRQKAKIVVLGFVIGTLGCGVAMLGALVFKVINISWMFIPMALAPVSVGYAIAKHNLFDADVVIRRSASYVIAIGLALVVFLTVITFFSLLLQNLTGQSSSIAAALAAASMIIVISPLQRRFEDALARRFFQQRWEYQKTIRQASAALVGIIDLDRLVSQILNTVREALLVERGFIFLADPGTGELRPAAVNGYAAPASLPRIGPDHPLVTELQTRERAVQINDLQGWEAGPGPLAPLVELMQELQVVLVIPILYERRLIGVLGLSEKQSMAWYSSEDIGLLVTLMMQTAVSIENARKVVELKRMVALESEYRELKKLDGLKDDFLAMVSHDLRAPMTCIAGYAELMRERLGRIDLEEQKLCLDTVVNESHRLSRLINNLLDLQRLEAGKLELEIHPLDLARLIQEAVTSFQGAAQAKRVRLENAAGAGEVWLPADKDCLMQVLVNLLSNAIKFTPEGGRVDVGLDVGGLGALVWVSDTGPGIRPEMQVRLFNKFQQGDRIAGVKERGSGLGLALAREIVLLHGGRVGMESEPGRGSRFFFVLPLAGKEGPS